PENCQTKGIAIKRLRLSGVGRSQYRTASQNFHRSSSDEITRNANIPGLGRNTAVAFISLKLGIDMKVINGRGWCCLGARLDLPIVAFKAHNPFGFPAYRVYLPVSKTIAF